MVHPLVWTFSLFYFIKIFSASIDSRYGSNPNFSMLPTCCSTRQTRPPSWSQMRKYRKKSALFLGFQRVKYFCFNYLDFSDRKYYKTITKGCKYLKPCALSSFQSEKKISYSICIKFYDSSNIFYGLWDSCPIVKFFCSADFFALLKFSFIRLPSLVSMTQPRTPFCRWQKPLLLLSTGGLSFYDVSMNHWFRFLNREIFILCRATNC